MDIEADYTIRKFEDRDATAIIDIFNHFIVNSFAAYAEEPVGYEAIAVFKDMTKGYPFFVIETAKGNVTGLSFLRPFHRTEIFSRVGEITYFILPGHTRKGLGKQLLDVIIEEAKKRAIDAILASISSLNEQSIAFHLKNGFFQCGCFKSIGKKFERDFDMVWMQKRI